MRLLSVTSLLALLGVLLTPAAAAAMQDDPAIDQVLSLTNVERQRVGLPPLAFNLALAEAAATYSQVLADSPCFDHTCGPTPNFQDRDEQAGYTGWSALGENIAGGYTSPAEVVHAWMASPAHRANVLSAAFHEIGVGLAVGADGQVGVYWTQEFGSREVAAEQGLLPQPTVALAAEAH